MLIFNCSFSFLYIFSVGRDFAGEVAAVGHGVSDVSIGDKVFGVVSPHCQGSHAEYVVTSSSNVSSANGTSKLL